MSGALRKTMVYLGLAEDQGRHDYDYDGHYEEHYDDAPAAPVTSIDSHRPVASVVRQHAGLGVSRITTIHPRTYNEARTIGENFRDGVPVIIDDALGHSDPDRIAKMNRVLTRAGENAQVIVLTCSPERYRDVESAQTVAL